MNYDISVARWVQLVSGPRCRVCSLSVPVRRLRRGARRDTIGVIMVMLGRLESNQRGTYFQSTVLVEAKTAQVVPHTLTHHEHSTSKLHGAPTHSTAHTKHK